MIHFILSCVCGHNFDGWFKSNTEFEKQQKAHLISCPLCGSLKVEKALMAPALCKTNKQTQPDELGKKKIFEKIYKIVRAIKKNAIDVGKNFPEEARKIHFNEAPKRLILGQAHPQDIRDLAEEGIKVLPLPDLPEEKN